MTEEFNEFQVIVKLNFVNSITGKLEDAVFEGFELGAMNCSALLQDKCGCGSSMSNYGVSGKDVREGIEKKWNRRASPWVAIGMSYGVPSGKLPNDGDEVLIRFWQDKFIEKKAAIYCKDSEDEKFYSAGKYYTLYEVTHWMPIPEIEG